MLMVMASAMGAAGAALEEPSSLVRLSARVTPEPVRAGGSAEVVVTAEVAEGWHINSNKPSFDYLIPTVLSLTAPEGISIEKMRYPASIRKTFSFAESALDVYEHSIQIQTTLRLTGAMPGEYKLEGRLTFQACDDEKCLPPAAARIEIPIRVEPEVSIPANLGAVSFENVTPAAETGNLIEGLFRDKGVVLALLFIFWSGVALNLTPCVYPMIPITVAYFGGRSAPGSKGRPVFGAVAYFLGIVLTYSLLGTLAGLGGGLFGEVLQNPFVLIGLAVLMLYLSAGMFGWVSFALPAGLTQKLSAGRGVPLGSFGMGATMGVVAAPCIGPFVVGLLAYVSSRQSPILGFALFAVLSAGLGLPYLFLGIFSDRIRSLPKLNEWMDVVKWIFGFVLLGMAVFFTAPLIPDAAESKLYGLIFLTAAATMTWVAVTKARRFARVWCSLFAIGLVVAGAKIFFLSSPAASSDDFWLPYDAVSFESTLAAGRPVVLDFYAEWCLPCKKMDRTTYRDPRLRAALEEVVRLKVDLTLYDNPESTAARKKFWISGVPTLIYIDRSGREQIRFVGEFSAAEFLSEWSKLQS